LTQTKEETGVKTIIFDLGRVLLDFDHRISAKKIARLTDKDAEQILGLFFDSELTLSFEAGRISPLEFYSRVKEMLGLKINYREFVPIWQEIFFFSESNRQVYELALKLKEGYQMALLSNINALHFEYIQKKFPIFDAFHIVITSFELGYTKPDPLAYQKALDILGSPAYQTFYADDRAELVTSAKTLGIKSFLFTEVGQLKRDLIASGVRL